jgi:hypothetical protein
MYLRYQGLKTRFGSESELESKGLYLGRISDNVDYKNTVILNVDASPDESFSRLSD